VYGRKECKNESVLRNVCSRSFVAVLRWLSDYRMDFNTCMFRMVSRRVVDAVLQFKEREPSLTFIMGMIGFPTASVEVTSGVREHGQTNYSFLRQINLAISSIVSFSTKTTAHHFIGRIDAGRVSLLYFMVIIVQWCVFGIPVAGWATIIGMLSLIAVSCCLRKG
jgi:dolichol-phosphate mannosyltransferase